MPQDHRFRKWHCQQLNLKGFSLAVSMSTQLHVLLEQVISCPSKDGEKVFAKAEVNLTWML